MSDLTLPFTEAFGPTIQGEGSAAGRLSSFVRFGGCNLSCSWCDSAYTWDASRYDLREEIHLLTVDEIVERTPEAPIIIITGGEPLLNNRKPQFWELLRRLKDRGAQLHMETNGTLIPTPEVQALIDLFVVSPKLPHAGEHKRSQDPALNRGWQLVHDVAAADLKIVCKTVEDVQRARRIADEHGWPEGRTWVMPEGTDVETLNARFPELSEEATRQRINITHRLHVIAWSDKRGH